MLQKRRWLHKKINRHRSPWSGTTFEHLPASRPPSFLLVTTFKYLLCVCRANTILECYQITRFLRLFPHRIYFFPKRLTPTEYTKNKTICSNSIFLLILNIILSCKPRQKTSQVFLESSVAVFEIRLPLAAKKQRYMRQSRVESTIESDMKGLF